MVVRAVSQVLPKSSWWGLRISTPGAECCAGAWPAHPGAMGSDVVAVEWIPGYLLGASWFDKPSFAGLVVDLEQEDEIEVCEVAEHVVGRRRASRSAESPMTTLSSVS